MKQTKNLIWHASDLYAVPLYKDDRKVIKLNDLKEIIENCNNCPVKKLLKKDLKLSIG